MSTQPIWITPAGSLGTVAQGTFYEIPLDVVEPDNNPVYFQVVAGALPSGIECTSNGIIQGVPTNVVTVAQETVTTGIDITSKFAIRAYTTKNVNNITVINRLADRTFTITVAGQNIPAWITPPGKLTEVFVGQLLSPGIQLQYTNDNTTGVPPPISLISGSLPPGLTLSNTGLISGYVQTNPTITALAGFSRNGQGYDMYPYDFSTETINFNYEFALRVTDGQTSAVQAFSIFVWATSTFNSSTTLITADDSYLAASISNINAPVLLNPQGSIGTAPNNTYFAYQFIGVDINGDQIGYFGNDIPPGLTLDATTGWLYGYLPNLNLTEITYDFQLRAYLVSDPNISSDTTYYNLTVTGPIATNVKWLTFSNLGTIANGATSLFYVEATTTSGLALQYRLVSGSNSRLPQGLTLAPTGNIIGRVSFDTFSLDYGTTTFDVASGNPTTFDSVYNFTVNVYSANGFVSVNKDFSITVKRIYDYPYNNLYILCMPPINDRELIGSLLENVSIFPPSLLFRSDDPNFGRSSSVIYYHAYGLNAVSLDNYLQALQLNHYWKNLQLGSIKTAQALDPVTGKVIYEVVYSEVIDTLVNNYGESVDKEVLLPYPINPNTTQEIDNVYPNSLNNMRNQVIDSVGQESNILPLWMLSKQSNGNVLGFTPAWVIAYTIPGASGQIAYNIETQFGTQLNLVDFKADRYELDNALTVNWDPNVIILTITNILGNGNQVTVSYSAQTFPPFKVGARITLSHVTPISYNGTYFVLSCSTTQVTFSSIVKDTWLHSGTVSSTPQWIPTPPISTTFDINYHYQTSVQNYSAGGTGYRIGDQIKVLGSSLNGESPINDCLFVVDTIDENGAILNAFCYGTANLFAAGTNYSDVIGINITGTGAGALWNIVVVPGVVTVFDGNSIIFNEPANMDIATNAYNKYVMFPQSTIIGPSLQTTATWSNDYNDNVTWINNSDMPVNWVNNNS
jgi:hypothetical protein